MLYNEPEARNSVKEEQKPESGAYRDSDMFSYALFEHCKILLACASNTGLHTALTQKCNPQVIDMRKIREKSIGIDSLSIMGRARTWPGIYFPTAGRCSQRPNRGQVDSGIVRSHASHWVGQMASVADRAVHHVRTGSSDYKSPEPSLQCPVDQANKFASLVATKPINPNRCHHHHQSF